MKKLVTYLATAGLLLGIVGPVQSRGPSAYRAAKAAQETFGEKALLNINNMAMWFERNGSSGFNPLTSGSGVTFPRSTDQVIYRDGLIWGGLVKDGDPQELRVGGQTYRIGTVPGRIISKGVAEDPADPSVRIYRIRRDYQTANLRLDASESLGIGLSAVTDSDVEALRAQYEQDWREWPYQKGAPYYDNDGDGEYNPDTDEPGVAGADQVAWFVINDLDVGAAQALYGSKPVGLEVQVLLWGYARTDALGDVIFKKFTVIYKGTSATPDTARIEDMYFAQWSDPDLGDYGDDFAGADIDLSLGYVYNSINDDSHYVLFGLAPPAVGYDFLQGPAVPVFQKDENGDSLLDEDGNLVLDESSEAIFNFGRRPGYRNLPMTSFVYFAAGSAIDDPELGEYIGTEEWYNLLRGFQPQPDIGNPVPYTNPLTGDDTFFTLDGDPTTAQGWNDGIPLPAGDRRIVLNTGPFEMALGDTQEVVVALLGGISTDRLRSVSKLKFTDQFVQDAYNSFFEVPKPPAQPNVRIVELDQTIVLNWGWEPESVSKTEGVGSPGFDFEGYNVYQLPSAEATLSQGTRIATFDIANGVTTILGIALDEQSGVVLDVPLQIGNDSGLQRYITLTRDALRGGPLVNGQQYYFAVTAYSRATSEETATTTTLESSPQNIICVPQVAPPGITRTHETPGDTLAVEHTKGIGDVNVWPLVVDPTDLQQADYKVTFNDDATWSLSRGGEIIVDRESNISLDESYPIVEGLQVKVGNLVFTNPTTYISDEVTNDANPGDGDLRLWGDGTLFGFADGYGSTFWEGGGAHDNRLVRDIEFRFTGVWNADSTAIAEGGSMATLGGVSVGSGGRDIAEHPFKPAEVSDSTGAFLQRVPFEIWDVEDPDNPRQLNAVFYDRGADGSRDDGSVVYHQTYNMPGRDYITIVHTDYDPTKIHELTDENTTWVYFFRQGGASVWSTGDVIKITIGNTVVPGEDELEFSVTAETYSEALAKENIEKINVFPNPYLGVNSAETSRYSHFVTFSHLPPKANIRIFDMSGTLVRTIEKDDPSQFTRWNLQNHNALPVASGMYIAHIELPDHGESRILKLAIIQEQQFLENF
ncbi:MAG: T9SS type A sorting domain-containing protein [Gemmatimonadota bacterium]|nr:T9SS type A sorting domain-containing protein [Gemmatimonadota bacterium]